MKKLLVFGAALAFATAGMGAMKETNGHWVNELPTKSQAASHFARPNNNLITYHGGDTLVAAKVVPIFWGGYWGSGTGATEASTMISFFQQYGTNGEYNTITQYYDTVYGSTRFIGKSTLTQSSDAYFDSTNPSSTNVTDAMVQGEVNKYLAAKGYKALDSHGVDQAIYEVFIPNGYYSSDGTSTSCGGPHLAYCAYHGSYSRTSGGATKTVKYSIEPYPSCSGCHASGFSVIQDAQHFACHETREAVTDPVNAWWNGHTGYEADDQCAWSPAPFIDGGFGYQYEWSNADNACVKTK
jgi:hypothetical protein